MIYKHKVSVSRCHEVFYRLIMTIYYIGEYMSMSLYGLDGVNCVQRKCAER